jgi:hypothetical protein
MKRLSRRADEAAVRAHSHSLALTVKSYGIDKMNEKASSESIDLYLKAAHLLFQMHTLVYLYIHRLTSPSFLLIKSITQKIPIFKQSYTVFVRFE